MTLNQLRDEVTTWARSKGWHDEPRTPGDLIALGHSEFSEALEEVRNNRGLNEVYVSPFDMSLEGMKKPEGVPIELADVIIRIADMAGRWNIDLDAAVAMKMAYNQHRPYRHGGKLL